MNFGNSVLIALAIVLATPVASAAEAVWPKGSASEFSTFVALRRFQIYADHCSAEVPQLEAKFASLMEDLTGRIQGISQGLFASEVFKGMNGKPVPAEIVDAFKDSFNDSKHNVERRDAASICPKALRDFNEMDDESLQSSLKEVLTAVQNMIRNLEMQRAAPGVGQQLNAPGASHWTRIA